MNLVVLCGGNGTRLWPVSRSLFPKQFVKFTDEESLFQKTLARNSGLGQSFTVVINQEQYFLGLDQLEELGLENEARFVLEPVGRNTAPAIALAAFWSAPDEILMVVPSDHIIENLVSYNQAVETAVAFARENKLVTFGIRPGYAETGFGYLEVDGNTVKSFREKPDLETAKGYVFSGNYLWNSGMFCFKAGVFLEELKKHSPDIFDECLRTYQNSSRDKLLKPRAADMKAIRSESIDYAVMEKSSELRVVPLDVGWNDLGSFDALDGILPKDENGNTRSQGAVHLNSKNNFVLTSNRLVSTIDVEDLIVIDTNDALLVTKKGSSQKVKDLVQEVNKTREALTTLHSEVHRPWGTYTVLEDTAGYKVKKINVRPGARLSLQYHHHRSEHWIVVSGTATVTIGERTFELKQNESTYIPKEVKHRLENLGTTDLVIIEAQIGEYLKEDDIVRVQDDYLRN